MNEHPQNEDSKKNEEYRYHWNYAEQVAFESKAVKSKRKRGIRAYAIATVSMFLACFIILTGVLIWHGPGGMATATEVMQRVGPATVLIQVKTRTTPKEGSGFIIRSDGYIVTNEHVIAGYTDISVVLYDGTRYEARYIGSSEVDDLAVLKIEGTGYHTVKLGDSASVLAGEVAIAIGNPAGSEAAWSVTQGIISATHRIVRVNEADYTADVKMIQTDAALNKGNSGGPLCNSRGEVIGVISRKLVDYEGIAYAIPINEAMTTVDAIIDGTFKQSESTVSVSWASMGITASSIERGTTVKVNAHSSAVSKDGVLVEEVNPSGRSYNLLQPGDVIYEIDGVEITNLEEFEEQMRKYPFGDATYVIVKVERKHAFKTEKIRLG